MWVCENRRASLLHGYDVFGVDDARVFGDALRKYNIGAVKVFSQSLHFFHDVPGASITAALGALDKIAR